MESLSDFVDRCRRILESGVFTPDATLSVVYAGRPGKNYESGPGSLLALSRGGRLMLFTAGYPSSMTPGGANVGYDRGVLYVWPSEWVNLPYLAKEIGAGRHVMLHGADSKDPDRPRLPKEFSLKDPSSQDTAWGAEWYASLLKIFQQQALLGGADALSTQGSQTPLEAGAQLARPC